MLCSSQHDIQTEQNIFRGLETMLCDPLNWLFLKVTGCFGPIPAQSPGRFSPISFRYGRFGPILGLGCFGPILAGCFVPLYFI